MTTRVSRLRSLAAGIAAAALASLVAITEANAKAADLNDYPTNARADYVFGCMKANGDTRTALDQCSSDSTIWSGTMPDACIERPDSV